ncbi:MAG TPA: glycosyltransferase family 2 protein [Candidatus Saccharibacteria bacterium]|nr:glycosyltransferase family 2 protein [Candidatus Saccharibacteria bacterium]
MKTNIAVVIPNWNGKHYLKGCIDSLLSQSIKVTIIVVDNGSVDGSPEYIEQNFPQVKLIKLTSNHGFTGGVNAGIKDAIKTDQEFVALFNNDAVADKHWLENLVTAMTAHKRVGIVTGKFMRDDKQHLDSTGDFLTTTGLPYPRGRNEVDKGQYDKSNYVFGATGGASLYRVEMLKQIGLFDEKFFAYFEDVDISFRAQLAGWKVYYEPKAIAYHKVGGTSSKLGSFSRYHSTKNFHLLFLKNMPGMLFWKYFPLAVLQSFRMAVGSIVHGQYLTHLKGYFAAVILLPHCIIERRKIQKSRKVSTAYIDSMLVHGRAPKPDKYKSIS